MIRAASIFALFLFVLFGLGYYHLLGLMQAEARHEIKSKLEKEIPESDLCILVFYDGDRIEWVKEEKEFRLGGKMYDVVRSIESDGKTIYYCIDDKKEARLLALMELHLQDAVTNGKSSSSNNYRVIVCLFPNLIAPVQTELSAIASLSETINSFYARQILSGHPRINTPPPVMV